MDGYHGNVVTYMKPPEPKPVIDYDLTVDEAIAILKDSNPNHIAVRTGNEEVFDKRDQAFNMAVNALRLVQEANIEQQQLNVVNIGVLSRRQRIKRGIHMNDATIPFEEYVKYLNGEGNIIGYEDCDILTKEDPDCEEIDCCIDCYRFDTCINAKMRESTRK